MKHRNALTFIAAALVMSGCAATRVMPEARGVELVNEPPDMSRCRFIGEVVGSQGNWFTGDLTPNKNLVIGARNELRNEAYKLGGNVVYIQDMKSTVGWGAAGITNTTAVGKVYKCRG